jgi:uncharacterized protein
MTPDNRGMHSYSSRDTRKTLWFVLLFVLVAVAGLTYVKWWPYYHKAFLAAAEGSIGSSILSGVGAETGSGPSWQAALDYAAVYFKAIWKAAVLGIILGSLLQVLIPAKWLYDLLGKTTFKSTLIGGAASLPGMMCSCCAAPVAAGMRRRNASIGASLAFWIGNPVLNPATLVFMTFVLSWKYTLIRIAFGILLTFGVSHYANRVAGKDHLAGAALEPVIPDDTGEHGPWLLRWLRQAGIMTLHIVPAYVLAVLLLGAFQSALFPVWSDGGILAILLFAIVGTLFVIPTAAEIPIVQSFLAFGSGAGPAAALLITLPAVSLPSVLMLARSFPKRVLLFVMLSVMLTGILCGLLGAWIL